LAIGLLGLIVSLFDVLLYRRSDDSVLAGEAQLLQKDVMRRRLAEQRKMLADSGIPQPADVGYLTGASCACKQQLPAPTPHAAPTSSC
jgi:hypothetical protein